MIWNSIYKPYQLQSYMQIGKATMLQVDFFGQCNAIILKTGRLL